MDSDVGELSVIYGAANAAPKTYGELFERECPYYMAMGMSYEQFWDDNAELVVYYRKAEQIRQKRKNEELWLQGLYIYEALCDTSPLFRDLIKGRVKAHPYCTEPKPLTPLEVKEYKEKKEREKREKIFKRMREISRQMRGENSNDGS